MKSHLITLTLFLTIGIVTTGFVETSHGREEAPKEQIMSFYEGDTIYADLAPCESCGSSVGGMEKSAWSRSTETSVVDGPKAVTEYVFPVDELVLDVPVDDEPAT